MSQTYQRTDSCGLSCPTVTHDHDTPDIRINYVHDCSKFHLLLPNNSAEGVHRPRCCENRSFCFTLSWFVSLG